MTKNKFVSFKLDKDVEKYYNNVGLIQLVESIKKNDFINQFTLTKYINQLIREDMNKFLEKVNCVNLEEYFKKNKINEVE